MGHLVQRLKLSNFGCFPGEEIELGPLTVLFGPNDSGKSTLLNAIRALGVESRGAAGSSIFAELGLPRVLWSGADLAKDDARVEVSGELQGVPYRADIGWIWPNEREEHGEQMIQVGDCTFQLARGPGWDTVPKDMMLMSNKSAAGAGGLLSSVWRMREPQADVPTVLEIDALSEKLGAVPYYRLDPTRLKRPSLAATKRAVPQLADDGSNLPTLLSVLASTWPERFLEVQARFRAAVPQFEAFRVYPTSIGSGEGHELRFKLAYADQELAASQVSDGAMIFLAMLAVSLHPAPPALVLLDEPENGVHPSRLREIGRLLRRLSEASFPTQIIATSHSPYLLDELTPSEAVFCWRRESGEAVARRFDAVPGIEGRLAGGFKLGELWASYGERELLRLIEDDDPAPAE